MTSIRNDAIAQRLMRPCFSKEIGCNASATENFCYEVRRVGP
jgi:hypothetical protein